MTEVIHREPGRPLRLADRAMQPAARWLDADKMAHLGIRNTMRLAKRYNALLYGSHQRFRRRLWESEFEQLAGENGGLDIAGHVRMEDGFAFDTTGSLPYLDEMLEAADEVIAERAGTPRCGRPLSSLLPQPDRGRRPGSLAPAARLRHLLPADRHGRRLPGVHPGALQDAPDRRSSGGIGQAPRLARAPASARQPGVPHRPLRPPDDLRDRAGAGTVRRRRAPSRFCPRRPRSGPRASSTIGRAAAPIASATKRSTRSSTRAKRWS